MRGGIQTDPKLVSIFSRLVVHWGPHAPLPDAPHLLHPHLHLNHCCCCCWRYPTEQRPLRPLRLCLSSAELRRANNLTRTQKKKFKLENIKQEPRASNTPQVPDDLTLFFAPTNICINYQRAANVLRISSTASSKPRTATVTADSRPDIAFPYAFSLFLVRFSSS